jgi:RHS repeat-associated protein
MMPTDRRKESTPGVSDPTKAGGDERGAAADFGSARGHAAKGEAGDSPGAASSLLPALTLPKGGGAVRGIGEKFSVAAATGTASLGVPLAVSPGRAGSGPAFELSYDSGGGNGPFGLGFRLSVPTITRKSDQGLPRYFDAEESDEYTLSGAEDLVPTRNPDGSLLELTRTLGSTSYRVRRYRPRVEGLFARIERWMDPTTRDSHFRVTTRENVTHVYGESPAARISDPADPRRVFSWLLEETRDDRGNVVRYEYKPEDGRGIDATKPSERSRFDYSVVPPRFTATAQRYLKRVQYCNRTPFVPDFSMEVVFDYGEHGALPSPLSEPGPLLSVPSPDDSATEWSVRSDPFSTYRSGFEVRTYRLCRRVLMFHKFEATPLLVGSTDFSYEPGAAFTYLVGVTQAGYLNDASTGNTWQRDVLPTLRLDYRRPDLNDVLSVLPKESLEGLEGGVDGSRKQWVDLDGEGIPGVLIDSDYAWYYKSNRGSGKLDAPRVLSSMPSPATLADGSRQLEDLAGDGQLDLVAFDSPVAGYFSRTPGGGFEALRNFDSLPNIDFRDPNLRSIDLDGDGLPDLLVTEDHAFVWYRSRGKAGFETAERLVVPSDDDEGPAVVFADSEQAIQLADMSGDGLVDIVRIRNGEVSYWPNLGYGRFGKKVTLENSPRFDEPDQFDPRRVRFGDVDGSGTSDLFYLGRSTTTLYRNNSGNALASAERITSLPPADNVASLGIVDLLGNGTATLVWSTPLPAARSIFYVDLMGGRKPHLLEKIANNLGGETHVTYASSTKFYLEDKAAGIPWLTRLTFPVHVVERIERFDHVSNSRVVSTYRYAHGFFDGVEREFRGFARVEQRDAEEFGASAETELFQAPVRTVTWFHTGAWLERERLEVALAEEYHPRGPKDVHDPTQLLLRDTILPAGLTIQDEREAMRALRGRMLRQEIYAEDQTDRQPLPYLVTEQNFAVQRLQSAAGALHGVFLVHARESVTVHTERTTGDPRVLHELILDVDEFGNVTRSASVAYARKGAEFVDQEIAWSTLLEADFINRPEEDDWYRVGIEYQRRSFELTGLDLPAAGAGLVDYDAFKSVIDGIVAPDLPFETHGSGATLERRVIAHRQQTFASNDQTLELALGEIESRALPFTTYDLGLTAGLVQQIVDGSTTLGGTPLLPSSLLDEGRYVQRGEHYWTQSGRVFFNEARFLLPDRATDAFGGEYRATYDDFSLFVVDTRDPVGNVVHAEHDYRVLAPREVTTPNLNRTAVAFDALGMVTKRVVMGKTTENLGDTLENPTLAFEYDRLRWQRGETSGPRKPAFVHGIARELHVHEQLTGPVQHSYTYSDGFGRVVMQKVQAEPGDVPGVTGTVDPRWVGTGRTVFNNKGNPVKQYEPFFSTTFDYEAEALIVEHGVTPKIHYDPLDRVIRTELPDGSETRVAFGVWSQTSFDQNDAVLDTPWLARHQAGTLDQQLAATRAAAHAGTPTVVHLDSLGRPFRSVAHNRVQGVDAFFHTRTLLDVQGNVLAIVDARQHAANPLNPLPSITQVFDVLGRRLSLVSADAGRRWEVADVTSKPLRSWDDRGQTTRSVYDALQRPTHAYVRRGATEALVLRMVYGESLDPPGPHPTDPNDASPAQQRNLRGQVYLTFDGAGLAIGDEFDFKANPIQARRRIATAYLVTPIWNTLPEPGVAATLEADAIALGLLDPNDDFTTRSAYDALNRVTESTTPDLSRTRTVYNRAGLLEELHVAVRGGAEQPVITGMEYNARGQRFRCQYANGTSTRYEYDPFTFRLTLLETLRASPAAALQRLRYVYDAVGNVVVLRNAADTAPFFNGTVESGDGLYVYDAVYRLISATGREHPGQQAIEFDPDPGTAIPHANDMQALRGYTETYEYDPVGNITRIQHTGTPGWTRNYDYASGSNRLLRTSLPGDPAGTFSVPYGYSDDVTNDAGAHGLITSMLHLPSIEWDHADRLRHVDKLGGGDVYFTYSSTGQRARKVWVHSGLVEERIYLGGFELYRRRSGSTLSLERETLHLMDDQRRVAIAETKTVDTSAGGTGTTRFRFQLDDHLGSATVELDQAGNVITYEEYHPYGSTAFHAASGTEVSRKRYRYAGKERDDETGFNYHGARYYAPWLGRWTAPDPLALSQPGRPDLNVYAYTRGNPVGGVDPTGFDDQKATSKSPSPAERLKAIGIDIKDPTQAQEFTYTIKDEKSKGGRRQVTGYYIPGKSDETALIYAGIHGDERAGKEIAKRTAKALTAPGADKPDFTTIIIPDVIGLVGGKGTTEHKSREYPTTENPNRGFLPPGESIQDAKQTAGGKYVDARGKEISPVNAELMRIREALAPERILHLHGVSNPKNAGVFTDPRPGQAEAGSEDRTLTGMMSFYAKLLGAGVKGNDPEFAAEQNRQPTDYPKQNEVKSPPGRASAGETFSKPILNPDKTVRVPAANVVLIETSHKPLPAKGTKADKEIDAYVVAITSVFLRH